ncbi:hypothetical protein [Aestuariivirga sp.]|uniref:hypothetical protein n=1 Tax=Aestuariivirga sp. TaxID=2650926 RepID=UPI0039E568B8
MTGTEQGLKPSDIFAFLMESLHWDHVRLQAYQRSQLEQLLRHAKAQVPFYEKRLDVLFRPDGTIDWSRWNEVPVLTRADLRDHGDELIARILPPGHGRTGDFYSSGSTGVPIKVTTTELASKVLNSLWARVFALNGVSSVSPEIRFWFKKGGNLSFDGDYYIDPNGMINGNRNLSEQRQLDVMAETGARKLTAFAGMMVHLAMENMTRKDRVKLDLAIPYGMAISEDERALIRDSFGATVISPYSSKESGLIGFQVLPDPAYVVCAEALLIDFLPAEGDLKRLIVTPFFNAAQPLIRYDQGDLVQVSGRRFGKGALPVIERVVGRADDYFIFHGQRVPVAGLKDEVFLKSLRAKAFQIAQTASDAVEVRYIGDDDAAQSGLASLTQHLKQTLKNEFSVVYIRRETLPTTPEGKPKRYLREWSA